MLGKKKEVFNMLDLTPIKVNGHEEIEGLVTILIPKFKKEFLKKLIPKSKPKDIRVKLDDIGSAVWLSIDGNKNLREIVSEMREKFQDKIEPAEERISKFIGGLNRNNIIYFKELRKEK